MNAETKEERLARLLDAYPNVISSSSDIANRWKTYAFEPEVKGKYFLISTGSSSYALHFDERDVQIKVKEGYPNNRISLLVGKEKIELDEITSIIEISKTTYESLKRKPKFIPSERKDFSLVARINEELGELERLKQEALTSR